MKYNALVFFQLFVLLLGNVDAKVVAREAVPAEEDRRVSLAVAALDQQIALNEVLIAAGRVEEVNYVVDMPRIIFGRENPFLRDTTILGLNNRLDAYKSAIKAGVYLLISLPYAPKANETEDAIEEYKKTYTQAVMAKSRLYREAGRGALINIDGHMPQGKLAADNTPLIVYKSYVAVGRDLPVETIMASYGALARDAKLRDAVRVKNRDQLACRLVHLVCQTISGITPQTVAEMGGALASILSTTDPIAMMDLLTGLDAASFKAFTPEQRIHIVKVLSKREFNRTYQPEAHDKYTDDLRELTLISVLDRTLPSDALAVRNALLNPNDLAGGQTLLNCLIKTTDDEFLGFIGENNYLALMKVFSALTRNASDLKAKTDALETLSDVEKEQRLIFWDKSYFLKFNGPPVGVNDYTVALLPNGNVRIDKSVLIERYVPSLPGLKFNAGILDYNIKPLLDLNQPVSAYVRQLYTQGATLKVTADIQRTSSTWYDFPTYELSPFDLIGFVDRSDISLLNEASKGGEGKFVPAIFLKYAADKQWNQKISDAAALTGDIVTLAVPVTKLATGARWAHKLYRAADIAGKLGAAGNIAVNQILDLGKDSKFRKVVDAYNAAMAVVGLWQLGKATTGNFLREAQAVEDDLVLIANEGGPNSEGAKAILQAENEIAKEGELVYQEAEWWRQPGLTPGINALAGWGKSTRRLTNGSKAWAARSRCRWWAIRKELFSWKTAFSGK